MTQTPHIDGKSWSRDNLGQEARAPFRWLPDAQLDPHPKRTWLIQCAFDLCVRALYRKDIIVASDYALEPNTLVVSNHQRDADVPIIATVLCQRDGLRFRWPLPFSASREDMFEPGFLGALLERWPRPVRALLSHVPLDWLFRIVRVRPMRRVREFTLRETLTACAQHPQTSRNPDGVLNPRGQREILKRLGQLPSRLESLLAALRAAALRPQLWGLRRIRRDARRTLAPRLRAEIEAQLAQFAALLDAGRIVYFSPEGGNSETGEFRRVRAGVWRVCRLAASPPAVVPVALSYDPLSTGRVRVIARVGTPLRGIDLSDRRSFDAVIRTAILRLYAVTPSHLASRFLSQGPERFTTSEFVAWLQRGTDTAAAAGLTLDPLFAREAIDSLAVNRLAWLSHKRLIEAHAGAWRRRWPRDTAPGWRTPEAMVRYLDNALEELVSLVAACLRP